MADFSANTWKEQDSANTAPSPHGFPTGAAPSTLHPSIRNLVGASVRAWRRINGWYTTTGTATALILTPEQQVTAYVKERWGIVPNATNTGAMTLNVSSLGAKNILRADGSALVAGDIASGQFTELFYNGTEFRIVSGAGAKFTGSVSAASFHGDGSALTNLNATELKSGTIHNDRLAGTYDFSSLNLSNTLKAGTVMVDSTGQPTLTLRKAGKDAANIYYDGSDNLVIRKYDATTGTAQGYLRIDGNGVNDAKYNGQTIWHAGNDGAGTGLDADLIDGYHASDLYRDNAHFTTTGDLTISNGSPSLILTDTTAGSYNTKIVVDANNWYLQKQADGSTAWTTFMQFEMDTTNAYANGSQIWTDAKVTANSINGKLGYTAANNARQVIAGNGLSGGGNFTADRTITLGTPGNITNSTTNSVSSTSHTHALGFTAAEVYTGTSSNNTNYPIGTCLWAYRWEAAYISRAQTTTLRLGNDGSWFGRAGSNAALSGSWAHRGDNNGGSDAWGLYQRIS